MKNKVFGLWLISFLVLSGCGQPLMDYDIDTSTPIVESFLLEGSNNLTVKVYSMEEYLKDGIKMSKPIPQLKVFVNQIELTETSPGTYFLDLGTDTIRANQQYSLQFDYNGKTITATTTVLPAIHSVVADPTSLELPSNPFFMYFADTTLVNVTWDDPGNHFYQVYIESPNTPNLPGLGIYGRRMMQPFQGNTYKATIRDFRSAGVHTIHVYRISKDYAELYERISASDLANPVSYIHNAFGIFTSLSTEKATVRVIEID